MRSPFPTRCSRGSRPLLAEVRAAPDSTAADAGAGRRETGGRGFPSATTGRSCAMRTRHIIEASTAGSAHGVRIGVYGVAGAAVSAPSARRRAIALSKSSRDSKPWYTLAKRR